MYSERSNKNKAVQASSSALPAAIAPPPPLACPAARCPRFAAATRSATILCGSVRNTIMLCVRAQFVAVGGQYGMRHNFCVATTVHTQRRKRASLRLRASFCSSSAQRVSSRSAIFLPPVQAPYTASEGRLPTRHNYCLSRLSAN